MPFIRGRYHINPIAGQALEAAREAEEALGAPHDGDHEDSDAGAYEWEPDEATRDAKGPIHRVEIETASLVPAHSGQATDGFVARIHRAAYPGQTASYDAGTSAGPPAYSGTSAPLKPETHVFAKYGDLVDFLQRELARDSAQRRRAKS